MKYNAYIKNMNPVIEEEITIVIGDMELVVFVNVCPYVIEEGKFYPVVLDITVLDELEIEVLNESKKEFIRDKDSFRYEIRALITDDGVIDAGILIDTELIEEYKYLYGEFVSMKVDRINAEFLS